MKIIIALVFAISVITTGIYFLNRNKDASPSQPSLSVTSVSTPNPIDVTASFEIYTNGTKRIFSDTKYHNQSEDVFITSNEPNIIYVKKARITWGNFFETLPMKLTSDCLTTGTGQVFCTGEKGKLSFEINGTNSPDALTRNIESGDKLVVTFE